MMYNNKLVACIKHNGKILREFNDIVKLPFGDEYTILLKNQHNLKAKVTIEIDGQQVFADKSLILEANSQTEITRFVNDLSTGNSFKFIERTNDIEQYRGIKVDDGIIRISFKFEQKSAPIFPSYNNYEKSYPSCVSGSISGSNSLYSATSIARCAAGNTDGFSGSAQAMCDAGITVPGSINTQEFKLALGFVTETTEHIMIFKLSGYVGGQQIDKPITTKTKTNCITCGTTNKMTNKFCSECGTSLIIV